MPRVYAAFLISLLVLNLQAQDAPQNPPLKPHIDIMEGDGALINVKSRVNPVPVVQVVDDNNKPLAGLVVFFVLPSNGPGGDFANGTKALTVTTGRDGRAAAKGIVPNAQLGQFEIRASVSYQGQSATATITQTNVSGISTSGTGGGISKKGLIILAIVGGAAAGIALGVRGGGGSSSHAGSQGITITAGTPSVGAPH